jgi:hypothetical protein
VDSHEAVRDFVNEGDDFEVSGANPVTSRIEQQDANSALYRRIMDKINLSPCGYMHAQVEMD